MTRLASGWSFITADEYCSSVRDGTHDSPKSVDQGYPLVTSRNIKGGLLELVSANIISPHDYEEINRRSKVDQWDVLYSMIGTIGEVYLVESEQPEFAIKNIGLFKCNSEEDGRWLSYWLRSSHAGSYVRERLRGATQQYIPLGELRKLPILIPANANERKQIIHVLKSYDDLIENNRKRIDLLEESARLLYREWFIKLRFPGYESRKEVEGIPEGWSKGSVVDFVSIMSGGTPNTKSDGFWGGDIPFFTPKDCTDSFYVSSTEKTLTESGLNSCNSRLFPKETIFITARGTVGKLTLAQQPMAMNQSCYALAPKAGGHVDNLFLFLAMLDAVEFVKQMATGGVFDTIVVDTFKKIPFLCPDAQISLQFGLLVRPIFEQIENLLNQNLRLTLARDDLLPKLMSGQLAA